MVVKHHINFLLIISMNIIDLEAGFEWIDVRAIVTTLVILMLTFNNLPFNFTNYATM